MKLYKHEYNIGDVVYILSDATNIYQDKNDRDIEIAKVEGVVIHRNPYSYKKEKVSVTYKLSGVFCCQAEEDIIGLWKGYA